MDDLSWSDNTKAVAKKAQQPPLPKGAQEEQAGGEATCGLLQSHCGEYSGLLHLSVECRQKNSAESDQHDSDDHCLLSNSPGQYCQLLPPLQGYKHCKGLIPPKSSRI